MAQLKDTTIKGALEVESSVLLNNNIEFKRTYIGPDGTETTHQHPIININDVSKSGMSVLIESQGTKPLFLGSSEQASALANTLNYANNDNEQDMFLSSGHNMRFYSGTNYGDSGRGLKESMRLNTTGNLIFYREPIGGSSYMVQFKDGIDDGDYYGHIDIISPAADDTLNTRSIRLTSHSKNIPSGWTTKALNTLELGIDDTGTRTVYVSAPAAWRDALNISASSATLAGMANSFSLSTSAAKLPLSKFSKSDPDELFSVSSNGIKVAASGTLLVIASAYFYTGFTANDSVGLYIYKNSTNVCTKGTRVIASNAYNTESCSTLIDVNAGDVIYLYAKNATGARGVVDDTKERTFIKAAFIRRA